MRGYQKAFHKKAGKTVSVILALALITGLSGCGQTAEEATTAVQEETLAGEELSLTNPMDSQKEVEENLKKELEQGYSFEEPLVVLDPYGNSPLTAVAVFTTEKETAITITVKGKSEEDNITQTFEAATDHLVPIYGLYAGDTTEVVLETAEGETSTLSIETDESEFNPGDVEVDMQQESEYNYGELTFISTNKPVGYIYAIDSKGDLRWYRHAIGMPFKQLENGHVMYSSSTTIKSSYYQSGLVESDLLGKIYQEYVIPGGVHHDFYEMENGNLLVCSDSQDFSSVEDYIVEIDRTTGEVVYELDMKDLLDTEDGGSINRTDEDWFHNNGIWYDEASDTILLSARHVDAIVGVNKTDKTLSYIIGDPEGWTNVDESLFFTPVGDDFEWQYAQHQVSIRPDGTILMFDNGAGRTKSTNPDGKVTGEDVYSRAVAYKIDTENMTIEQVFSYGKELGQDGYSEWISGAISINDDANDVWITSGAHLTDPETGSSDHGPDEALSQDLEKSTLMTEVKNGEVVCAITTGTLSYRSIRMAMYTDTKELDLETEGTYIGSLGVTKEADAEIDFDNLTEETMDESWILSYDPIHLSLTGTYNIDADEEEAPEAYIVLENADGRKVYSIGQTLTAGEENNIVSMIGWVSPEGLEGESFTISIVIGDSIYNTGKKIIF
ncbi:MAG: aryl-sulfate sulfotransferase [Lachnospiraceae bacterium]|nr:aryl-sulfate sulfotransferase [Lachnospiraceae bacterium]